jgi:hypothetical protein
MAETLADATRGLDDWDADELTPRGIQGTTACGRSGRLGMPGLFSRMGAPRCKQCCGRVGVLEGRGVPYNDEALSDKMRAR